jgi:hypothetical protein
MNIDNPAYNFGNDQDGYRETAYDGTANDNIQAYQAWKQLCAIQNFEAVLGEVSADSIESIDEILLEFPYHPRFPEAFFAYLTNRLAGCPPLTGEAIDTFLESYYAVGLEKPDCDYLLGVLRYGRHVVQAPDNIARAVRWLNVRRSKLPAWPALYSEPDTQGKRKRLFDDEFVDVEALKDDLTTEAKEPATLFDGLLRRTFLFSSLRKLFQQLDFIDQSDKATGSAKQGIVAGVVYALRERHCFSLGTSYLAIGRALVGEFGIKVSPSTFYGGRKRTNKAQTQAYLDTLAFIAGL